MIANRRFFIEITDFTGPLFRDPVGPSLSPVSVGRVWTRVQVHEAAGTSSCVIGRGTPSGEGRTRWGKSIFFKIRFKIKWLEERVHFSKF